MISRVLSMPFRRHAWHLPPPSLPLLPRLRCFARVGSHLPTQVVPSRNASRFRADASPFPSRLRWLFSALPPNSVPWTVLRSASSWLPVVKLSQQLFLPDASVQTGLSRWTTSLFVAGLEHDLTSVRTSVPLSSSSCRRLGSMRRVSRNRADPRRGSDAQR